MFGWLLLCEASWWPSLTTRRAAARVVRRVLPEVEERGLDTLILQHVENPPRILARPVVERQRDHLAAGRSRIDRLHHQIDRLLDHALVHLLLRGAAHPYLAHAVLAGPDEPLDRTAGTDVRAVRHRIMPDIVPLGHIPAGHHRHRCRLGQWRPVERFGRNRRTVQRHRHRLAAAFVDHIAGDCQQPSRLMAEVVVVGQQRAQRRIDADLERRVVHSDRNQPPVVIPHPIRPRAAARQQQCRQGHRQNDWPPATWTARSVIAVMRYSARNAVERQFLDSLHNPLAPLGVHTMIRAGGLCSRTGMGVPER